MAKKPEKKTPEAGVNAAEGATEGKVRSARGFLLAAIALSLVSLGGGFFLARMAFMNDAQEFEPDYVEVEDDNKDADKDKDAKNDNGEKDADKQEGKDGEKAEDDGLDGLLEFDDITTDITSYGTEGVTARAFLKLSLTLVYRPDAGARQLVEERQAFMRDLFTTYARSLTEPEVRGAAGLLTVKSELLKRARAATGNNIPQDILIRDIIVQ